MGLPAALVRPARFVGSSRRQVNFCRPREDRPCCISMARRLEHAGRSAWLQEIGWAAFLSIAVAWMMLRSYERMSLDGRLLSM
jgi:hypothetical protein